jgi:hypothetical protein
MSPLPEEATVPLVLTGYPPPVLLTVIVKFDPDRVAEPVPFVFPLIFPLRENPPPLVRVICISIPPLSLPFIEHDEAGVQPVWSAVIIPV